jgi:DNA recombination protein RmuC
VDAKFPVEDYARLREAEERGDGAAAEAAGKALVQAVKVNARTIAEKYLKPPATTDFGVMFLPSEGLYGEVARRPGLLETLQRDHRVVVAGPATFAALLNSLQVGFRTLAIRERTGEVLRLLGAVKADFGKFALALDAARKRLEQAQAAVEEASRRSRTVEKRLRGVEALPEAAARELLPEGVGEEPPEGDEA